MQALVDGKNFPAALNDFDAALRLTPASQRLDQARLLAGRGLAYEGISDWVGAMKVGLQDMNTWVAPCNPAALLVMCL